MNIESKLIDSLLYGRSLEVEIILFVGSAGVTSDFRYSSER